MYVDCSASSAFLSHPGLAGSSGVSGFVWLLSVSRSERGYVATFFCGLHSQKFLGSSVYAATDPSSSTASRKLSMHRMSFSE